MQALQAGQVECDPRTNAHTHSYQYVFDEIEQVSFCKYGARPHWYVIGIWGPLAEGLVTRAPLRLLARGKNSDRVFTNPSCPVRDKYERFDEVRPAAHTIRKALMTAILSHLPLVAPTQVLEQAKQYDPHGIFVSPILGALINRQSLPK